MPQSSHTEQEIALALENPYTQVRDENIDSCTLKWKRGYRHSHSPMAERIFTVTVQAAGEDRVRRSITWSPDISRTVSEMRCLHCIFMATENLQIKKAGAFPVQKGHPLGTASTLGLQFKKNSGNEGNCRNQTMISFITALRA